MHHRSSRGGKGFPALALIAIASSLTAVSSISSRANAQTVLQPVPGQPAPVQPVAVPPTTRQPTTPPSAGAATAPGAPGAPGAAPSPLTMPPTPPVDDPMLAPADPAKRMIVSWQEATQLVRARSTDLATAYAEIRRAEAQTRVALAAVLPTANATASLPHQLLTRQTQTADGRTVDTPTGDYVNLGISASQSIVNLQAWHTIKTTKEQVTVNTLSAEDTTRVITLQVATSIVGVVASERIAELNRVGLRSALERRNLTSRKRNLGVATGLDVVRADQDVSFARATLVTGDESLRRSREALGLALGIPDQVGVPAGVKIDEVVASAERTCPRIGTLAERADIAAQQKRIEIADRNVHNVELGFLPTLSATSNYATSTQDSRGANLPATWSISAVLSVPIWDGGARYGILRSNRALRDEAGYALEAATRNATVQIEQARRSISVAEASRDVAQQTRDLAAEVDQLTQIGYRAGQGGITSLELVIAAAALRQAEISLALREFDVVSARLDALFSLARCAPLGAQR